MKLKNNYYRKELGIAWYKENGVVYIWINLIFWQFQFAVTVMRKKKNGKNS